MAPKKFQQFYLNDSLSDFVLLDGDTGKRYDCHRVVLASASALIKRFLSVKPLTQAQSSAEVQDQAA